MKLTHNEYVTTVYIDALRLLEWESEYTPISKNKYNKRAKRKIGGDEGDCGVNESCFIECATTCIGCENNKIRRGIVGVELEVAFIKNMGRAVFALRDIPKKCKVIEYVGEVINKAEVLERMEQGNGNYIMKARSVYIDAKRYGNMARFINHSCEPNCQVEEWYVDGLPRLVVVATRLIRAGEEVTFDYGGGYNLVCKCNSKKCKGII